MKAFSGINIFRLRVEGGCYLPYDLTGRQSIEIILANLSV